MGRPEECAVGCSFDEDDSPFIIGQSSNVTAVARVLHIMLFMYFSFILICTHLKLRMYDFNKDLNAKLNISESYVFKNLVTHLVFYDIFAN